MAKFKNAKREQEEKKIDDKLLSTLPIKLKKEQNNIVWNNFEQNCLLTPQFRIISAALLRDIFIVEWDLFCHYIYSFFFAHTKHYLAGKDEYFLLSIWY